MEGSDRTFSDIVGLLKSWVHIPWRTENANLSKDFWMPDQSCRVCYECDSAFTLFNRRHHCRLCGRIFCGKCTSNWVPTPCSEVNTTLEEWEKIRVCNYCYKQWIQDLSAPVNNGVQGSSLDLISSSPSATSFISTKSSGTCASSTNTFLSLPQSAGLSPYQSPLMEITVERETVVKAAQSNNTVEPREQNRSQNQFVFYPNRSDDEEEFGISHYDSVVSHFSDVDSFYGHNLFGDIDNDYQSRKVHPDGDAADLTRANTISSQKTVDSQASEDTVAKSVEHEIVDECEATTSSLYATEEVDAEPVDFENNGVLWVPPEPEDEEDEKDALLFADDDDEGDSAGEWGYLRTSSSFGSGEFRNRDKSNEGHKKAMKNVVDGHFRALVAQLLQVDNLLGEDENDEEGWLEIITALSWEAAVLLKPDMSKSGQMDPGGYVKVKCLATGRRSESMVVKGVVCRKNVAHRRMTSKIEKPRLLILGGALEYQRVATALSSFDTLLQQEMDHLKMAVAKIDAHHPDVLLVEKSVSRYAQEYLLAKDITLVLNMKRPLLERIARCSGAQIVPSIDNLSSQTLGYCDMFHVEKLLEEHGTAGQAGKKLVKTLMYFEGCPQPLGCTILLRGANGDELKKVKHVIQYGIFAAYHLALETSFLADEGATMPELPLNSPITVALPSKASTIDRSISTIPGFTVPSNEKTPGPQSVVGGPHRSNSVPVSELMNLTMASVNRNEKSETYIHAKPVAPLDVVAPREERGSVGLSIASEAKSYETVIAEPMNDLNVKTVQSDSLDGDVNGTVSSVSLLKPDGTPEQEHASKEEFPPSPSDHQSILVSLSSRCVWKGTVCERSHLFRIKYYGNFDKPLGRFLRDHLFDQNYICRSCEMPAEAHVQCYTHRQGTLTISVKKLPEILLPGEKDGKIWMWHRCLKCPRTNGFPPATRRVVMSDAAWGLSFGKFLELSFSNHAAASRVASCGHSLHRDCLRFYGFGKMVACFRYASIDVHSVYLPPFMLGFNHESQEWVEKELAEVTSRAEILFSEVVNALRLLVDRIYGSGNSAMKVPESGRHITNLEGRLKIEKSEFEETLQKMSSKDSKTGQPAIDILELNQLRRQLFVQSYTWDQLLIKAADVKITHSEPIQEPLGATEKLPDATFPVKIFENPDGSHSLAAQTKPEQNPDNGVRDEHNSLHEAVHQKSDILFNTDLENKRSVLLSLGTDAVDKSGTRDVNLRRALSDGQSPICISDTLEAAWTGENLPVVIPKKTTYSESEPELSLSTETTEKLEDKALQSPESNSTEETLSWLSMSFASFYSSFNKNGSWSSQILETLSEYTPEYITSFKESEQLSGGRLLLPLGVNEIFLPVYDDEPTSIISYALASSDYRAQLSSDPERPKDIPESMSSMQSFDAGTFPSFHSLDEMMLESYRGLGSVEDSILSLTSSRSSLPLDPMSNTKALHIRVAFSGCGPLGKVKYSVTCYYGKRFEALRRMCCPSEVDYVRSLSRCKKWGAQGGKSNVFFAKTLDDRFIIKQVTKTELESFNKFAPGYFKYLSESIDSGSPTCLAKILGIYQVTAKHLKGGKESKMDVLVMENLLFGRNVTRLYDLKGSSRSRYNPDSSGSNKVLLDQNLIEAMPTSPIFVGNKAKRLLERAVWNDTAFLATIDVMDYSLLVGVDEEKHELVLGIIDFMRQYTWDKHLENWVKASGILGGPKNATPTVISPKQYKRRFRKAMASYFLMVPDQWSPPTIVPSKSQTDFCEENLQNIESMIPGE